MSENKYAKYVIREPSMRTPHPQITLPIVAFNRGRSDFPESNFSINWEVISKPFVMETAGHTHDWDQLLCFIGGNSQNFFDFGAEIEIFLGEERYFINTTTLVWIPKGLVHGPLEFKKIHQPIMFNNIVMASRYGRASQL
ncbi:MAG TPA: hypothetical protein VLH15_08235 [Dehalococcoidales bacterium]|nr:hypothetical protein [Dehalococcoidales bacterium]